MRPIRRLALLFPALLGVLVTAAPARAGGDQRFEDAQVVHAGLAPAHFRGLAFQGGWATIRPDGSASGRFRYGRDRRSIAAELSVKWQEPARAGNARLDWTPGPFGGGPGAWWSPSHQVRVNVKDAKRPDHLELHDLLRLAKDAAALLARRARPWPEPLRSLHVEPELERYALSASHHDADGSGREAVHLDYERAGFEVDLRIHWMPLGKGVGDNEGYWRPETSRSSEPAHARVLDRIWSTTHNVRIEMKGTHVDANRTSRQTFANERHLQEAHRIARVYLRKLEEGMAERRGSASAGGGAGVGTGLVVDRPPEVQATSLASGTIQSLSGRVMVIRNGRRVNLQAGGRVAKGDVIITGRGSLVIRFDDPAAGPGKNGSLAVAPRTKLTIDVAPFRRTQPQRVPRVLLEEGALRFARVHHDGNPRFEITIPGEAAIFGMVGTDALLANGGDGYVFALLAGSGDLTLAGQGPRALEAGRSYELALDGTYRSSRAMVAWNFRHGLDHMHVPDIEGMPAPPADAGGPAVPALSAAVRDRGLGLVRALRQGLKKGRAHQLRADAARRAMDEASEERELLYAAFAFEASHDAYEDLVRSMPTAAGWSRERVAGHHFPEVVKDGAAARAAMDRLLVR